METTIGQTAVAPGAWRLQSDIRQQHHGPEIAVGHTAAAYHRLETPACNSNTADRRPCNNNTADRRPCHNNTADRRPYSKVGLQNRKCPNQNATIVIGWSAPKHVTLVDKLFYSNVSFLRVWNQGLRLIWYYSPCGRWSLLQRLDQAGILGVLRCHSCFYPH